MEDDGVRAEAGKGGPALGVCLERLAALLSLDAEYNESCGLPQSGRKYLRARKDS